MGGICSKRAAVDKSPSDTTLNADGLKDQDPMEPPADETMEKEFEEHVAFSFSDPGARKPKKPQLSRVHSERSTKSKPTTKASPDSFIMLISMQKNLIRMIAACIAYCFLLLSDYSFKCFVSKKKAYAHA